MFHRFKESLHQILVSYKQFVSVSLSSSQFVLVCLRLASVGKVVGIAGVERIGPIAHFTAPDAPNAPE